MSNSLPAVDCERNSLVHSSVTLVGSVCIFYFLLKVLIALRKLLLRDAHDLGKRYGACTWVLITGATSPCGNGLAVELAKRGFNIILVGRDTAELQKLRDVLMLHYGQGIKVRIVVADFRESVNLSFYTEIMRQIEDLDISIVIHAVGMAATSKKFHQLSMEKSHQCLVINMFAPVLLSHQLIPRMQQRYHRSAIIIVGGENAKQPIPGMSVSSGAKAFIRNFAISASAEYEEKIDILTVQPFGVRKIDVTSSTTSTASSSAQSIFVIDSERFAKSCLAQLGHERSSSGDWLHQLLSWFYSALPQEVGLHFWASVLSGKQATANEKKSIFSVPFLSRKSQ